MSKTSWPRRVAEQAEGEDPDMTDDTIERTDLEASFASNQRLWDAWTKVHAEGEFYDVAGFRQGGLRVRPYEIAALGDVTGKTLLHLQCHFGLDTLSWARLGATVTEEIERNGNREYVWTIKR